MTAGSARPGQGRARTVFLGSGAFAVPSLAVVAGHPSLELLAVVTAPPLPRGRGSRIAPSPVGRWAAEHALPVLTPSRLRAPDSVAAIRSLSPSLLVLADYGQLVPPELLELPEHGALNVHPSLLPRHRGATPIPAAILAGDAETGVSVMRMDAGLDTGPLIARRVVPLAGDETAPELEARLATVGAELLDETLAPWLAGELGAHPQPAEGATVTRPLRRADGRLDPSRTAEELARQVRAYQPWPGSWLETMAGRLVVWSARPPADGTDAGELPEGIFSPAGLRVADGYLALVEVQPAGGRRMSWEELVRGRPGLVGSRVLVPAGSAAAGTGEGR